MTTQGIEARSGETGTGSTEGESPSGKAGAPKLDWTAPLMLDDGEGTGVEVIEGPDRDGDYRVRVHAESPWYSSDGTPIYSKHLPRIINRPKPDAEPVEWGPPLTGPQMKSLNLPGDTLVQGGSFARVRRLCWWELDAGRPFYRLPADHPAYTVLSYNEAHPDEQPYIVHTGNKCPVDGDVLIDVLFEDGSFDTLNADYYVWDQDAEPPIIGYRIIQPTEQGESPQDWYNRHASRRALTGDQPDTVTLPRMTEAEWLKEWRAYQGLIPGFDAFISLFKHKGLIRPDPTPLEQFTTAHPDWREMDRDEAVRLALEWGR